MLRFVLSGLFCLSLALPLTAQEAPLVAIMKAVRADEWDSANALARAEGRLALDIVAWRALRAGVGTFDDYRDFAARNPDWPDMGRLLARGEGVIDDDVPPRAVLDWFGARAPVTGYGSVRLIRAFEARGMTADAEAQAVLTWRSLPLSASDHAYLLDRYGRLLAPHHEARLDALLWQGAEDAARLMLPYVSEGWRTLAVARIALREEKPGVDAMIAAVPAALSGDPGLAWERFRWRLSKGRYDDAADLLIERSSNLERLGRPEAWADGRRLLARRAMRAGEARLAYRLAARHFLTEGSDYADLEWVAGYVALRQLDDPATALRHFEALEAAVVTPISLSRAGYWQGRALEALGRGGEAQAAYVKAAQHQTAFYGQLAAERARVAMDPSLAGGEAYPGWTGAPFARSSVLRAALQFLQAGERPLAGWFLTHLAETAGPEGQAQLAGLALELGDPYIALRVAKEAAGQGVILPRAYFPLTDLTQTAHKVPDELVLAIARRESEFNPAAVSGAGARGLMQLMPATAKSMAASEGVPYRPAALTGDPAYNARLGAAYLTELSEEFGMNPVLIAVAYNAGPSRARAWIAANGDPRSAGVDVVDWIEMIPFTETRNYVMRVTESLVIYRARLSGVGHPLTLSRDLKAR